MPHIELEYPKQAVNTVKRLPYRGKASDFILPRHHPPSRPPGVRHDIN